jgi:hypothetical protein
VRDRNTLLVAHEGGFGTVNLDEIDFESEVQAPLGKFFSIEMDSRETIISWRRTTAEQACSTGKPAEIHRSVRRAVHLLQMGEVVGDPAGNIAAAAGALASIRNRQCG